MTVRELQGWSPRTVTVDADGAVISVSVQEPRFKRDEVSVLLASRRAEKVPRGSHGHPFKDATNPDLQYRWSVPLPTTDFAQAALNRAKAKYLKEWPDADPESLLWLVERSEGPEATPG